MGTSVRQALNNGSITGLPSFFNQMQLGDVLRKHLKIDLRQQTPAADPSGSQLSTLDIVSQDQNAPASVILRAYARAAGGGGGTPGELTVEPYGTTPTTGQIAVGPNGSIVTLATDLWLGLDIEYMPEDGDVVVLTNQPVIPGTGVMALPSKYTTAPGGVVYLLAAAEVLPTALNKIILVPGTAPATTKANLNVAKTQVQFAVADAVTLANVVLYVCKGSVPGSQNLDTYLQSDAGDII